MFLKRTSPNLTSGLAARGLEFGDQGVHAQIISHEPILNQVKPCGTCDHDPLSPVFYVPPSHHQKRPNILDQAIHAIEKAYYKPKHILAKLFKPHERIKKSPRREAIIRVLQVMLQFMDIETLELGFYSNNGNFIRLDVKYIAKQARITGIRAKRALGDIIRSGYVESIKQMKKTSEGRYISFTSIRKFTANFFMDLGVEYMRFFSAREWKRKRNEKKLLKNARSKFKDILHSVNKFAKTTSNKNGSAIRQLLSKIDDTAKTLQQALIKNKLE